MGAHAGNRSRPAYSGQARFRFPPDVVALFVARPPLEFKPPVRRKRLRQMSGLADLVASLKTRTDDVSTGDVRMKKTDSEPESHPDSKLQMIPENTAQDIPEGTRSLVAVQEKETFQTPAKRRAIRKAQQLEKVRKIVEESLKDYDPFSELAKAQKTANPFNTLFVARLARSTTAGMLQAEFDMYGPIVKAVVPKDKRGIPRGYGFIEFEDERDLKAAYRDAAGKRIEGRRIIVDVERARTVKGWRPNRLDGPHNTAARAARGVSSEVVRAKEERGKVVPTAPLTTTFGRGRRLRS